MSLSFHKVGTMCWLRYVPVTNLRDPFGRSLGIRKFYKKNALVHVYQTIIDQLEYNKEDLQCLENIQLIFMDLR